MRTPDRRRTLLVTMCAGYFLVLLDVTAVNVALPAIGTDLGAGVADLQWVVDGYALALAALLLAAGGLGDLRGHERVVLVGAALFGAASLACGLAPGSAALVAARVAQGVGAALLLPGTLAIISRAFPEPAERARAIGIWAGIGALALPAGPLLGGALVQGPGWRWVFLANAPILLAAGLVAARLIGRPARGAGDGRPDWAGTVLGALTLAALTFAVVRAGHSGADPAVLGSATVALAAAVGFARVEARSAHPLLPPALLRRPAFAAANAVAGVMNLGTLGLLFLLTLFLQGLQQRSALMAGLAVLPLFLPLSVLGPPAGRLIARIGPRPVLVAGLLLAALGVALLASWRADTAYGALVPALLCWGAGIGLLTPAVVAAAIGAAPPERTGLASGVTNAARQAGGAIGVAACGALAGSPADPGRFLAGLHLAGLLVAGLYVLAAVVAVVLVPGRTRASASGG
jgi:DHA2 family methylenomycin A resistance protein-like MFS transporter